MKLTPIKSIDAVLKYLANRDKSKPETITEIRSSYPNFFGKIELLAILNKLIKDGYVETIETLQENTLTEAISGEKPTLIKYFISFEGLLFHQSGGYEKAEEARLSESIRLGKLENELKENRKWTLYLTILIAVGTLVAAIYYGIEIYKDVHSFCHAHGRYWVWETIPKK